MSNHLFDAILNLSPNANFYVENGEVVWNSSDIEKPTDAEIDVEVAKVKAEYDAQAYARNRRKEYPDMGTQLNKIYDDGGTKWKSEMIDPIKANWPKDNSGPVEKLLINELFRASSRAGTSRIFSVHC